MCAFQLVSTVTEDLDVVLHMEPCADEATLGAKLKSDQVLIRVEAAPINPSDLGRMMRGIVPRGVIQSKDTAGNNQLTLKVGDEQKAQLQSAVGKDMVCGNEGAGVVIATGSAVKDLQGKVVSALTGQMYTNLTIAPRSRILVHNDGVTSKQAASSFVNPLTVLCMIETFRKEKHNAIIHTAAASNLGQMLQKVCLEDNIPLINIVRKQSQEDTLKKLGAKYIVRSDQPTFKKDLIAACLETKATLAFDAIGGGDMADTILLAMEAAASKYASPTQRGAYGTTIHKQVYVYGSLNFSPSTFSRQYGMAWSIGGYVMPNAVASLKPERVLELHKRIADGITTTFLSSYSNEVPLAQALEKNSFVGYSKMKTGEKTLLTFT